VERLVTLFGGDAFVLVTPTFEKQRKGSLSAEGAVPGRQMLFFQTGRWPTRARTCKGSPGIRRSGTAFLRRGRP